MTARRLLSALVLALVGSGLFTFWIAHNFSKPAPAAAPKQQYVAAVKGLDEGAILQKQDLTMVEWSGTAKLEGAFAKPEDIIGRTVLYPITSGDPIRDKQLLTAGATLGLSTKIPDGMRAISLKSDQVVGVAGFLTPGTHVDVLVTFRTQTDPNPITVTVLQDAQILAAGQKFQADNDGKAAPVDVVTLLVKPNDAERVTLASAQGSVHFLLRNGSDHEQVEDKPADLSQLGGAKPVIVAHGKIRKIDAPIQPANQVYSVETVAGGTKRTESFQ